MENEEDVRADPSIFPLGADLVTTDERLNERNPRLVLLFAPQKQGSKKGVNKKKIVNKEPTEVEFGLDPSYNLQSTNMGLVFGLVLDEEPQSKQETSRQRNTKNAGRIVSNVSGISIKPKNDIQISSSGSSNNVEVTYYRIENEKPTKSEKKPKQVKEVSATSEKITTQDSDGCWVTDGQCTDIITVACAGAATLDTAACASGCTSAGVAGGPIGYTACFAFCEAISSWWGAAICATQADTVCEDFINSNCS
ncbi:hypothetical protein ELS19_17920 [Halogeometricum borinquense]|uniref:Uncharacterized protein n=1 Tax=Halogeometricum borinquense TaxID=60847 RepID=A0A482SXX3_9EURY|nr:hypothetical protein [Halogeometricum borinquense]RYJ08418.1 hypothetical protein ELS19_17920 [Halogeometricum borinquense]